MEKKLMAELDELWHSFLQENPCVQESRLGRLLARVLSTHHRDVTVLNAEDAERHYDFTSSCYFVITSLTAMGKIM